MKVAEAIQILSQRRRFHVIVFTLLAFNFMFIPVHEFIDLFLMYEPDHHCRFPDNDSKSQWIPFDHQTHKYLQCEMYETKLTVEDERELDQAYRDNKHCQYTVWDWRTLKLKTKRCKNSDDYGSHQLVTRPDQLSEGTPSDFIDDSPNGPESSASKSSERSRRSRTQGEGLRLNDDELDNTTSSARGNILTSPREKRETFTGYSQSGAYLAKRSKLQYGGRKLIPCRDGVVFSKTTGTTLVTEFNLTCEGDVSVIANSVMGVAMVTGAVVFAPFVDKYGRKTLFMMVWCQNCLLSIGIALVKDIRSYWVLRFLSRFYIEGVEIAILVLAVEMLPSRARPLAPLILYMAYALGQALLSLQAMLFSSWWQLQLAVSVETIIMVPFSWFLVPESIHWLVSMRRTGDAEKLIRLGCRMNGIVLPEHFRLDPLDGANVSDEDEFATGDGFHGDKQRKSAVERLRHKQLNVKNRPGAGEYLQHEFHAHVGEWNRIYDLMKNHQLRSHFFIVSYMWAIVGFLYYGLTVSTMKMKGNLYRNYCLSGLVMVPASVSIFILRRFGRKKPVLYFLIGAGVSTTLSVIAPYRTPGGVDLSLVNLVIKLLAKYCVVSCLISIRLLIIELFPTPVRGSLIGLTALIGLLGSALGYYFSKMISYSKWVGFVVGILTLIAAGISQLLPETSNRPLPDTINDIMTACSEMFKTLLVTMPTAPAPPTAVVSDAQQNNRASKRRRFTSLSTFSVALRWKARGVNGQEPGTRSRSMRETIKIPTASPVPSTSSLQPPVFPDVTDGQLVQDSSRKLDILRRTDRGGFDNAACQDDDEDDLQSPSVQTKHQVHVQMEEPPSGLDDSSVVSVNSLSNSEIWRQNTDLSEDMTTRV